MSTPPPLTFTPEQQAAFAAAYKASFPLPVQAIFSLTDGTAREALAQKLVAHGYSTYIDVDIMVWGWDPLTQMDVRIEMGLTWVPSGLQLPLGAPGGFAFPGDAPQPGQSVYNPAAPPAGSIKVSNNIADYPPFVVAPPVPAPAPDADPVGPQVFGQNMYLNGPGASNYPVGKDYTDPRGTFVHLGADGPMGLETWWEMLPKAAIAGEPVVN